MLKEAFLRKSILLIESEIEFFKLFSIRPDRHSKNPPKSKHKVFFIPNSQKGLGIDSMGEFTVSFELSRQFVDETGKPAPFIHIAEALETAFHFNFGDVYKSKARIFSRKPYNLSKALDYLKNLIFRGCKK